MVHDREFCWARHSFCLFICWRRPRCRPWTSLEEARKTGSDSSDSDEEGDAVDELRIQALERTMLEQPLDYDSHVQHHGVELPLLGTPVMCSSRSADPFASNPIPSPRISSSIKPDSCN
ncbi:uncharacterized protein LOC125550421 isoform X2 [Triticum urartu]|uniref:uncharacterized protein LOC125550421 isoform X2 n=1 Tax=Triticum urartu TaxID=4572 RepID=UPI00204445FD|nr:uncharacterized protein LOC125550421 isoform X2 [Triticum urartu]